MVRKFFLLSAAAMVLALTGCGESMDKIEKEMAAREAAQASMAAANLVEGEKFLAERAKEPGMIVLPSGVMYKVVSRAATPGPQPKASDTVTINYEGKLLNGHVFDSSYARNEPTSFPLSRLVPAWQEVIPMLKTGDEIMLYTPPSEAYGEADMGEIPPNSTLIFRIQLLGIEGK
jgi:FKBP-type peptidyl-prolyl cis-trans isomerase FklB